jgi:hypothetical protein
MWYNGQVGVHVLKRETSSMSCKIKENSSLYLIIFFALRRIISSILDLENRDGMEMDTCGVRIQRVWKWTRGV